MEQTLVLIKPSGILRNLIGDIIARFQNKGLVISGLKMMQLDEEILREHYAHLVDRPFFPSLLASMMRTPVIAICLKGVDAVQVVRNMTGATNGRKAEPGTIRGDYSMSGQENIVHASDSVENAMIEINRFFAPGEVFDYTADSFKYLYAPDEA
ncbi:MAG: nucleoside-diphosphate kinase [Clostridiales bacterium]|nr:nucleoside-diphosphate kinase [Clostridiales bacterium]